MSGYNAPCSDKDFPSFSFGTGATSSTAHDLKTGRKRQLTRSLRQTIRKVPSFQLCPLMVAHEGTKSTWKENRSRCGNPAASLTGRTLPRTETGARRNLTSWPPELIQQILDSSGKNSAHGRGPTVAWRHPAPPRKGCRMVAVMEWQVARGRGRGVW